MQQKPVLKSKLPHIDWFTWFCDVFHAFAGATPWLYAGSHSISEIVLHCRIYSMHIVFFYVKFNEQFKKEKVFKTNVTLWKYGVVYTVCMSGADCGQKNNTNDDFAAINVEKVFVVLFRLMFVVA